MRLAAVVAMLMAAVAVGQVSPADAQEREIIAKLLASERDSDKAWSAVLAANYRQPRFVPEIVELLKSSERRVRLAALDALIRLNADPPEDAMKALIDAYPEHVDAMLILIGRRPGVHRAFLETLLGRDQGDHHALHTLLALSPGQKQVSYLWNAWTLRIRVLNRGQGDSEEQGQVCVDRFGVSLVSEYPQSPTYTLLARGPGALRNPLVTQGPQLVDITDAPGYCYSPSDYADVADYLQYFARPVGESPETVLRWSSAAAYETEAADLVTRWRSHVSYLRGRLIESKLLTFDAPWPKIEVVDERHDKSVPIPSVDFTF